MMGRLVPALVLASSFLVGMAAMMFLDVPPRLLADAGSSGMAAIALLSVLPIVDLALFGRRVEPHVAGVLLSVPVGFFAAQSRYADAVGNVDLGRGAGMVLATAAGVSVMIRVARMIRRRRLDRSTRPRT